MAVVNGFGGNYARHEPVVDCSGGRVPANVPGSGVRLERVPDSAFEGIWLDDFAGHDYVHDQLVFPGVRGRAGRAVAASNESARGGYDGGVSVGLRRVSGELLGAQAVVAVSHVRSSGRNRPGDGIHRADFGAGEMVSGSPGADYGDRRGGIRLGIADLRAGSAPAN